MKIEWLPIPSCPGYLASSDGRIRAANPRYSRRRTDGRGSDNGRGYLTVTVKVAGKAVSRYVHRLVCEAFHGRPPTSRHQAAHKNGNRSDNRPDNLAWKTQRENEQDKLLHGTLLRGEAHPNSKLTARQVAAIRYEHSVWGASMSFLASEYGVADRTIHAVVSRENWQ